MKRNLLILVVLAAGYLTWQQFHGTENLPARHETVHQTAVLSEIGNAYRQHQSNIEVSGKGTVIRILPDDNEGSCHQRFILRLDSGQTLLIAHNIDVAPRIASLEPGDTIAFKGEYEWNDKGGVIHWTHHDPDGRHQSGWLKHEGHTYQ